MKNFQSESKKSGDKFEDLVLEDLDRLKINKIKKHVILKDIGVEADFAYKDITGVQFYIEAKGGEPGINKRPGAKRTDNVKKAIANGALIKASYPDAQFVVYFSDLPKHGSSSYKMLRKAIQAGYISAVRYLIQM
jgi:hypothetical protein